MDDMLVDLLPVEDLVDPGDDCFGDNVSAGTLLDPRAACFVGGSVKKGCTTVSIPNYTLDKTFSTYTITT